MRAIGLGNVAGMGSSAQVSITGLRGPKDSYDRDCVEARQPELSRSLEDLNQVINRYDNLVGRLGGKLQPVLIGASPTCDQVEKSSAFQTDMANRVNSMRCQLRDITDNLESIIERVEL